MCFFSCQKKKEISYQQYIGQDYLHLICERIPVDWEAANAAVQLFVMHNDSLSNSKIPLSPAFLENVIKEEHLQILLNEKMINKNDLKYFLNSENREWKINLKDLDINCKNKFFKYNDGRDDYTCFYSQPFYTEEKKVFILKEIKFYPDITEINLICINNRIGKKRILNMSSKTYISGKN